MTSGVGRRISEIEGLGAAVAGVIVHVSIRNSRPKVVVVSKVGRAMMYKAEMLIVVGMADISSTKNTATLSCYQKTRLKLHRSLRSTLHVNTRSCQPG